MDPIFEINQEKIDTNSSRFVISPLAAGYGNTLGVSLRRVLLSSLPGAAITKVKIANVKHQFSTLAGMKEDVLDFLLNLKKVRFSYEGEGSVNATLSVNKAGEVKAGDIKLPGNVKVANPDLVLANLSKGGKLSVDITVSTGVGYELGEDREKDSSNGVMPMDAIFSPVTRVNYKVEETRVGRVTNYDKLILEVWTDGTVSASDALSKASSILVSYFDQIVNPRVAEKKTVVDLKEKDKMNQLSKLSVEEIGLPTRVANALSRSGYDTVEKLLNAKKEDLMKV
ncbi:MAG TPA: DNA-directed RNA polymerase subunit alpha, partial [Candidatus Saccharimonadales bacterium]|nr:DNA-directed RNA polymerase subunit alpha [Candidatus Saccharimonadales bacterium]